MSKSKTPTYQELSERLDELLAKLQQPDCDVDEAASLYEAALKTVTAMEQHLETAQNKVARIKADFTGAA